MGIVMEQDINDNENPILASSDCDHKEGLEYLVYFQKIDLMILQDPVRDIAQHLDLHIYMTSVLNIFVWETQGWLRLGLL